MKRANECIFTTSPCLAFPRRDPGWSPDPSWASSKNFPTGQNPCGGAEGCRARCSRHGGSEPQAGSLPRPPSLRGSRSRIRAVPSPPGTGAPKGFSGRCWDRRDVVFGGFLHLPLHTSEGSWVQTPPGSCSTWGWAGASSDKDDPCYVLHWSSKDESYRNLALSPL